MDFKVGDKVCWLSLAGGIARIKHGIVVVIVPANVPPLKKMLKGFRMGKHGAARKEKSWLVKCGTDKCLLWPVNKGLYSDDGSTVFKSNPLQTLKDDCPRCKGTGCRSCNGTGVIMWRGSNHNSFVKR
jgi:hypothetical protein